MKNIFYAMKMAQKLVKRYVTHQYETCEVKNLNPLAIIRDKPSANRFVGGKC